MKKVVVAMSGGVDSSAAAALLKRAGFDVIGVFMKLNDFSKESEDRAKKVAKVLKIPFKTVNFEKEFKKRIVDCFLEDYKKGLTPNPCVVCNKEIKFGLLLEKALKLDADFVATGHYARIKREIRNSEFGIRKLLKGKDKEKDQSYFLWMLNQRQLKRVLFPVGNYTRKEVENLARKFKLPVLKARKSVEICFIKTTINDFLRKYLKPKPGKIIDPQGKVIGEHEGLYFYTIGQRKGIGLPGGPYYVLDKNLKKNLLIVTKNEKDLYKKELIVKNVSWIHPIKCPVKSFAFSKRKSLILLNRAKVKIRYRHKSATATICKILNTLGHSPSVVNPRVRPTGEAKYKILFSSPQRAITPGQSVVFYKGQEVVGGGIIC